MGLLVKLVWEHYARRNGMSASEKEAWFRYEGK